MSQFQLGNIQSRDVVRPKVREFAMDLHTIQGRVEILFYSLRDTLLQGAPLGSCADFTFIIYKERVWRNTHSEAYN